MNSEPIVQKFINSAETAVNDSLAGLLRTHPHIGQLEGTNTLVLRTPNPNKVHLLCGGGSGHEPAHAGYLAQNGLSAAVCGGVFASPPTKHIVRAIEHLSRNSAHGVLVIIKNYTGDIINFESAVQFCLLKGIKVRSLVVNDDIAFIESDKQRKEARGLCGTVLLYKMLGVAATRGATLEQLWDLGQSIVSRTYTLNVSLGACALPGRPAGFQLEPGCYELGLGIHGQKGKEVMLMAPCRDITYVMLQKFTVAAQLGTDKQVVLVLNNLGGCSKLEMGILTNEVYQSFSKVSSINRIITGEFMTSLQMHGFSLTMLVLNNAKEELELIDSANHIGGWMSWEPVQHLSAINEEAKKEELSKPLQQDVKPSSVHQVFKGLIALLQQKVPVLNDLDREVGDGDTGQSIQRSLHYLRTHSVIDQLDLENHFNTSLSYIGEIVAEESAGSLGTILGRFLSATASKLSPLYDENNKDTWATALKFGIQAVKAIGKCQVGDRTVLDVLVPISDTLEKTSLEAGRLVLVQALDCCKQQCIQVSTRKAKKGRARYLNGKEIGHPDPGCELIFFVLEGLLKLTLES